MNALKNISLIPADGVYCEPDDNYAYEPYKELCVLVGGDRLEQVDANLELVEVHDFGYGLKARQKFDELFSEYQKFVENKDVQAFERVVDILRYVIGYRI